MPITHAECVANGFPLDLGLAGNEKLFGSREIVQPDTIGQAILNGRSIGANEQAIGVGVVVGGGDRTSISLTSGALRVLGRSVEPNVETLAYIGDEIVYVLGGAVDAPTPHLYIERETYGLRRIELPMPEGQYRVELASYELGEGWFPRSIIVYLDTQKLFQLDLDELEEIE